MAVMDYINELKRQRNLLADILSEKGVTASRSEKFNTLIPKVESVGGGGVSITGTDDIYSIGCVLSETVVDMNFIITGTATISNTEV